MFAIRTLSLFALAAMLATAAGCATEIKGTSASGKANDSAKPIDSTKANDSAKGNATHGQELFIANACATCHGVTKENNLTVGPNLVGVVGRKAGTTKSLMGPSENLQKYGVTWSAETLDEFLVNPSAKVPGTAMIGIVADPQQRADVIAYLSTLKE
jgi:cytochrome c